jgi:hypothetical protein
MGVQIVNELSIGLLTEFGSKGAALVLDQGGKLFREAGRHFADCTHIDMRAPERSPVWNCLKGIGNAEAKKLAEIICLGELPPAVGDKIAPAPNMMTGHDFESGRRNSAAFLLMTLMAEGVRQVSDLTLPDIYNALDALFIRMLSPQRIPPRYLELLAKVGDPAGSWKVFRTNAAGQLVFKQAVIDTVFFLRPFAEPNLTALFIRGRKEKKRRHVDFKPLNNISTAFFLSMPTSVDSGTVVRALMGHAMLEMFGSGESSTPLLILCPNKEIQIERVHKIVARGEVDARFFVPMPERGKLN